MEVSGLRDRPRVRVGSGSPGKGRRGQSLRRPQKVRRVGPRSRPRSFPRRLIKDGQGVLDLFALRRGPLRTSREGRAVPLPGEREGLGEGLVFRYSNRSRVLSMWVGGRKGGKDQSPAQTYTQKDEGPGCSMETRGRARVLAFPVRLPSASRSSRRAPSEPVAALHMRDRPLGLFWCPPQSAL